MQVLLAQIVQRCVALLLVQGHTGNESNHKYKNIYLQWGCIRSDKFPKHKLTIRNSTAEFLIFTQQAGENGIEVRYEDGSILLTQKLMAELFNVDIRTVSEHLQNIYASGELQEDSVIRKFRITAAQVGTVDKFQGQESPIVLVSMVTSSAADLLRNIEFLYSKNRLNVASRAQCYQ